MSYYSNFHDDFPSRCRRLLKRYYALELKKSPEQRLDVTLLLSSATSGFMIPFEQLRSQRLLSVSVEETLTKQEEEELDKIRQEMIRFQKMTFIDWMKSDLIEPKSWQYGCAEGETFYDTPNPVPMKFVGSNTVLSVLCQLRNSLAHANIQIFKDISKEKENITKIRLFSRKEDDKKKTVGYHVHDIEIEAFYQFLLRWFDFVSGHENESALLTIKYGYDEFPHVQAA